MKHYTLPGFRMARTILASIAAGWLLVAAAPATPPSFILILTDDQGLSRVGCYGGEPFKTPCIDRLAAGGLRFERFYSMPVCGPSRAALLTGKYPFRTGATHNGNSGFDRRKHVPLAVRLRQAGYATCAIGKLGQVAGENERDAPAGLGFDEYMLWMGRGTPDRYWHPRYHCNGKVVQGRPDEYGPDLTQRFLVDFMRRSRDAKKPFFAFHSACLPHFPFTRTPDSKDDRNHVPDMVAYQDKLVGLLARDLERLGLRDNTIIVFTTDNGPDGSPAGTTRGRPMIGGKASVREGGVRQPLIVYGPGRVPQGKVCTDLGDFTDIYPTLLELAGIPVPRDIDGRSLAPQWLGRPVEDPASGSTPNSAAHGSSPTSATSSIRTDRCSTSPTPRSRSIRWTRPNRRCSRQRIVLPDFSGLCARAGPGYSNSGSPNPLDPPVANNIES